MKKNHKPNEFGYSRRALEVYTIDRPNPLPVSLSNVTKRGGVSNIKGLSLEQRKLKRNE